MIRAILALVVSLVVAAQVYLLMVGGTQICFNDGCAVVDSLTRVAPLYFNIAGLVFFQLLFWAFLWGRHGTEFWHKLARLLLLCGMAVEGVLVFFQYQIAQVFCSYCLLIFGAILLLNLLSGLRQTVRAVLVFTAVVAVCFTLQFRDASFARNLDEGSIAVTGGAGTTPGEYLFFSASCPHCEEVIDFLRENGNCPVRFNPVEKITDFSLRQARLTAAYDPQINVLLLRILGFNEIPVLLSKQEGSITVVRGATRIIAHLREQCGGGKEMEFSGMSLADPQSDYLGAGRAEVDQDGCELAEDCADAPATGAGQ